MTKEKTTRPSKARTEGQPSPSEELVFVVDVTSFTEQGFVGSSSYEGAVVEFEFDPGDEGVGVSPQMAGRLGVKKGAALSIAVEDDSTQRFASSVASVGKGLRISHPGVYHAVGGEGGAVVRVSKA